MTVRTLLSSTGAHIVDLQDQDGCTPLYIAAVHGHAAVTEQLIEARCNVDFQVKDGYTPLHRACWGRAEGHTETVRVLLKAGAPADQMSDKGELPVDLTPNANTKKLIKHRLQKIAKVQISMDKDEM